MTESAGPLLQPQIDQQGAVMLKSLIGAKVPATGKPYRPSNGSEGDMFRDQWCERCSKAQRCRRMMRSMAYEVSDPKYPSELVVVEGKGVCTSFKERK